MTSTPSAERPATHERPPRGLLDTSVWISAELGRTVDTARLPDEAYVCVVTIAELQAGVLAASDSTSRSRRLTTLQTALDVEPLTVDVRAAQVWAELRVRLHEAGRLINVNDLWIAAVAIAHDLPVVTQDDDFDILAELGLLEVVRV